MRWNKMRYRKRSPVNTRAGAAEYELVLRKRILAGEPLEASSPSSPTMHKEMSFEEFARLWFETYVTTNNKPSEQTTKRVILRAHLLPWFGQMPLSEVTTQTIEQFKANQLGKSLKRKSINNHLAILGRSLRCAMLWGYIDKLPVVQRLKVGPPPFRVLTEDECSRLLADKTEPQWNLMAHVALRTGMRRGELMALDWSDIDFGHNRIFVRHAVSDGTIGDTKTYQSRPIPLMRDIRRRLEEFRLPSGLVFASPSGKPYSDSGIEKAIVRISQRTSIADLGWHTLRHTFATECANAGVRLHTIKELLGHSTITMTMRYVHGIPSMLDDAINTLERSLSITKYQKNGQPAGNAARKVDRMPTIDQQGTTTVSLC